RYFRHRSVRLWQGRRRLPIPRWRTVLSIFLFLEGVALRASCRCDGKCVALVRRSECVPNKLESSPMLEDDVAASQLAIDGQIEHRKIARSPLELQLAANRPNVCGPTPSVCLYRRI